ncbi:uncharacterized mitochondrial protein AtMg00300-like [Primulina huaijiensis]|uniref:uncharacterized mitochondrial protein AtMg00300-like n=1 Tax=Primulina huaijiensis TaxID=1492673 RepID=UPI003CC786F8
MTVFKGSLAVMKGVRSNGLYTLHGGTHSGSVSAAKQSFDNTMMWHLRLAHISDRGIQELQKQGLLGNRPLRKLEFCEDCVKGKSTRVKLNNGIHVSSAPLEYVHSDLWAPSRVLSNGGARYIMSIIDDYSRRVWVYILRNKNEALDRFKQWLVLLENQSGKRLKKLITDNGLEFCATT